MPRSASMSIAFDSGDELTSEGVDGYEDVGDICLLS